MAFLEVKNLHKQHGNILSVKDISFSLDPFQKLAIAGETGSGKTTLLKMIAGLVQPDGGEIIFKEKRVLGPDEKLMAGHPDIGYLSQHFELRNNYRVEDELDAKNILTTEEASEIYSICQIDHLLKRKTNQLSGGEKQRIALARILIASPELILLDEPFSNLDMGHKQIMKSVVDEIGNKLGITCMMVLHDASDLLSWAHQVLVMQEGNIIQRGNPEEIYRYPVNEYCAGLFGEYNIIADTSALKDINGILQDGKRLMVRPEDIHIRKGPDNATMAMVEEVFFMGPYYLLEVSVAGKKLQLFEQSGKINKGDKVYISISPEAMWYFERLFSW